MPFTLSHPAAVMPLCRRLQGPGLISALVIGSMSPDFIYWLPLPFYRGSTHTFAGLFTFCLPAGFVVFWLYHLLLRPPILAMLPRAITARLSPQALPRSLRSIALVLLAIWLGAVTHLIWDAFTHRDTLMTQLFPILDTPVWTAGGYVLRLYKVLQHGSTLVGLGVMALYGWRWYRHTPPRHDELGAGMEPRQKVALCACLIAPALLGAIWTGLYRAPWEISIFALQKFAVSGVIAGLGIFSLGLIVLGLMWPWVEQRAE